jgi:hypothetical protein
MINGLSCHKIGAGGEGGCLLLSIAVLALIVVGVVVNGYVISTLWAWFVMPLSKSIPALSVWWAAGLGLIPTWFLGPLYTSDVVTENTSWKEVGGIFVSLWVFRPILALTAGWILSRFVGG